MSLRLVIFDVDGTLVDSQADILAAMAAAFDAVGAEPPGRDAVLGIVGLSLPQAMARLAPDRPADELAKMVETYKATYAALRRANGSDSSPLYPGMRDLLKRLHAVDDLLLGIATGKSRRGLDALLDSLSLRHHFVTAQCADDHPSKPHPSMIHAALAEAGVSRSEAVMVGDTRFDLDMAAAAGVASVGVTWGYHPASLLEGAAHLVQDAAALERAILTQLGLAQPGVTA